MTAADLLTDPEFTAFCLLWERGGRCPLVFADWLRDRGMDGQADGAEWAALEPDRNILNNCGGAKSGIAPWHDGSGFRWWSGAYSQLADAIPADVHQHVRNRTSDFVGRRFRTFAAAVAAFLDAWASARTPATA